MFLEDYNRAQDLYMSSTCPVAALEVSESFENEQCVCVCVCIIQIVLLKKIKRYYYLLYRLFEPLCVFR